MDAVSIFRALGDTTRLAVLECLAGEELNVSTLTDRFEVSQPAMSQHLAILRDCNLVQRRREGKNIFYRANAQGMHPVIDWLAHYQVFWARKLPRLESVLHEIKQGK
jgi:DNA-binding transcriptional ArsR family regulator